MGLLSILLSRDELGHPIMLNYKGDENYPTKLGALLSIAVKVMMLIFLVQKTISVLDMTDPSIDYYERPLYTEEIDELADTNFSDNNFNAGIFFYNRGSDKVEIPETLGTFVVIMREYSSEGVK